MSREASVYLGRWEGERVLWLPEQEKNPHCVIVGTSGSGKTESLKAILFELQKQGIPSLIIDFHNEYADVAQLRINLRSVTINPLEVMPGKRPQDVVYEVANIIKKIFRLGDRQEALLRAAIKDCYTAKGVDIMQIASSPVAAPPFLEVREHIKERASGTTSVIAESLLNRIEALFEVDIFFQENTAIPFDQMMGKTTAIELKDFPTEDVKAAIAEFFLNKLVYYIYTQGRAPGLRLYCVVDEAHRLLYEHSPLDRLLREARKYGAGVILSSQRPTDFSETILANAGALLSLQCNLEKDAKFIGKQMGVDYRQILNLNEAGLGFLKLTSQPGTSMVRIERLADRGAKPKVAPLATPAVPPAAAASPDPKRKPDLGRDFAAEVRVLKEALEHKEIELDAFQKRLRDIERQKAATERDFVKLVKEQQHFNRPVPKQAIGGKLCKKCSFINEGDARFCTSCGRKF